MPDIFRRRMVLKDVTKINTPESDNGNGSIQEMEEAFLGVLERSEPLLQRVAWMFFKRKEDREELIQEVIHRAWEGLLNFRNESNPQTWLSSIAFQTAANWSRDAKRLVQLAEVADEGYIPGSKIDELAVIASLRDSEKEIVLLLLEGYEYSEISTMLGVPLPNLRNRIRRLKERLGI